MTTTLIPLRYKCFLNRSFIQVVLEEQRRNEAVVLLRKSSDQGHRCEFIVQLIKSEAGGAQIANGVHSRVHSVDEGL